MGKGNALRRIGVPYRVPIIGLVVVLAFLAGGFLLAGISPMTLKTLASYAIYGPEVDTRCVPHCRSHNYWSSAAHDYRRFQMLSP